MYTRYCTANEITLVRDSIPQDLATSNSFFFGVQREPHQFFYTTDGVWRITGWTIAANEMLITITPMTKDTRFCSFRCTPYDEYMIVADSFDTFDALRKGGVLVTN